MSQPVVTPPSPNESGIHLEALTSWLTPRLDLSSPLTAQRFQGGQSNPTWLLRSGSRAWVLRTKPAPKAELLPSAHAIEREYQVMHALQGSEVPVPRVVVLCEDESIIGVAFYLMEYLDGRVFRDAALSQVPASERKPMYAEAIRVIAALHRVDWAAIGLSGFGKPQDYFERLINRWTRQYRATETAPIEAMEQLIKWLPANIPDHARKPGDVTLVHGDFRIDNLVFAKDATRVLGVLDWELSTLGHPLSDLAYHCMAFHVRPSVLQGLSGIDLQAQQLPTERELITSYCQATGRDDLDAVLKHWPFYLAFNFFRLAAILQGVARRVIDGTAVSPNAVAAAAMAQPMAELGWVQASSYRHSLTEPNHAI